MRRHGAQSAPGPRACARPRGLLTGLRACAEAGARSAWAAGAAGPDEGEGGVSFGTAATTLRASAWARGERCCGSRAPFRPPSRRPRGAARSSWYSWQVKGAGARVVAGHSFGLPPVLAFPPNSDRPRLPFLVSQRFPLPFGACRAWLGPQLPLLQHPGGRHGPRLAPTALRAPPTALAGHGAASRRP